MFADPLTDRVIGSCFARLPKGPGWVSWHAQRIGGSYGISPEQQAAQCDTAKKTDHGPVDWSPLANIIGAAALEGAAALIPTGDGRDRFVSLSVYDAFNRQIQTVTPHNSTMQPKVMQKGYDQGGQLQIEDLWLQLAGLPLGCLP